MKDSQLKSIIKWIKEHPLFKWSGMCREIGFDKGNFQKIINGQTTAIKDDVIHKIVGILSEYGYIPELINKLGFIDPNGKIEEIKLGDKIGKGTVTVTPNISPYMKQRQQSKQSKK